ncbi:MULTISPECIES: DUF6415 family natural product biosynthesis protein [unclassified Streptomyces]|uniref:DUF6415 family natural product biosynthesis protein n=1 Tax=unclassified Streptomyces TaxID=2593676 RepID=UPI002E27BB01|nr:DUF6415 family natural product biosynthesis protein [Streptomyces sp. NBC_00223]
MSLETLTRNDNETLVRVLQGLRRSEDTEPSAAETPLMAAVLDDLEAVLGEYSDLADDEVWSLIGRLRETFLRFFALAAQIHPGLSHGLVSQAHGLVSEQPLGEYVSALGYLRRLAITLQDLMEHFMGYVRTGGP